MKVVTLLALAAMAASPEAHSAEVLRQDSGAPVGDALNSKTVGEDGGILLEDFHLIERLARFNRERIPERVVHARGTGAEGTFESTGAAAPYSKAGLFKAGTSTPVFVRFSTVIHPLGSPEALRDPRGFATKFYSTDGNWDLVGNNLPIFFIRDAIQFPDMVHSLKPSPISNKQDPNRFFDFFSHKPESTHMLTQVYSDLGTPASYREMDGNGVHAFRLINAAGETVFAKFRWKSHQGVKTLTAAEAGARDFSYATDDLYRNIAAGNFPKWDLMLVVLDPKDIAALDFNPFDATKDWLGAPFKEMKIGTMTLNKVPENFFQSTEQVAFAPGVMVPGIEPSPDRLLQGRLFGYADTQRYRVGANYQTLPVNAPKMAVANSNQAGAMSFVPATGDINFFPSRAAPKQVSESAKSSSYTVTGMVQQASIKKQNNFAQAGVFYRNLTREQKANLISNLTGDLGQVRDMEIKRTMISHFMAADRDFGDRLAKALNITGVKPATETTQAALN